MPWSRRGGVHNARKGKAFVGAHMVFSSPRVGSNEQGCERDTDSVPNNAQPMVAWRRMQGAIIGGLGESVGRCPCHCRLLSVYLDAISIECLRKRVA